MIAVMTVMVTVIVAVSIAGNKVKKKLKRKKLGFPYYITDPDGDLDWA